MGKIAQLGDWSGRGGPAWVQREPLLGDMFALIPGLPLWGLEIPGAPSKSGVSDQEARKEWMSGMGNQ